MDIITTHINADFDCLGAMVAAARLYPGALLSFPGSQEKIVRDFLARHPEYFPAVIRAKDVDLETITRLIIVDCQHAGRIGRFARILGNPALEVHIYDHHPPTEDSIIAAGGIIRSCGSTSTMLAEFLMEQGLSVTEEEATIMLLGIHEDTGRLLFPVTAKEDYRAASWLMENGARLKVVADSLSQEFTGQQLGLLRQLLTNLKVTSISGINISIAHASSDQYIGDVASLVHLMRDMENLDALFVAVAMEERVYVVARSRVPEIDAGAVLRRFGGGGHPTAASASVRNVRLNDLLASLDEILRIAVTPHISASHIMSSPVKTITKDLTISESSEQLVRYNCNAMPVMSGDTMIGIISRRIVEKAIYHGLGASPVTDFMHTEFMRALPDTLLSDIQAYMVEGNRRFVPVFDGDQLTGAVTRTDLLRYMYGGRVGQAEALYDLESLEAPPRNRSIAGLMMKRLSAAMQALLKDLGRVGDELGIPVFLVGGFVRDILIGIENLDIDITVEGDGIFYAECFAARYGCRIRSHRKFGTAVIIFPDGRKVDVASTRLEYYESPGVLPTVERGSLRHDVYRRDFTINTLAVCISAAAFGTLTDYFGGQQDIHDRVVRVLHNLSFVEDPTRVFRAVRFEQRLSFRIAPHTENLIRNAVRMNVLEKIVGLRLLNELKQIMREKEPSGAISRMWALGLLTCIHHSFRRLAPVSRVLDEAAQVLAWYRLLFLEEQCEQWKVYFLAMCDVLAHEEFAEACLRLAIPPKNMNRVFLHRRRALGMLDVMQRRLKRGDIIRNSEVTIWFRGLPVEMLLYIAAAAKREEVRRLVSLYITRLSRMRPMLDGDALKKLGLPVGPAFSSILEKLLTARLDGEITTIDDEKELAVKLIAEVSH